jgi:hypothetical protein
MRVVSDDSIAVLNRRVPNKIQDVCAAPALR